MQEVSIRAAASRAGLEVAEVYTDSGFSGAASIERRPGLFGALSSLERGDVLLVAKRDRLGRDPIVVAMAERIASRRGAQVARALSVADRFGKSARPAGAILWAPEAASCMFAPTIITGEAMRGTP